MTSEQLFLDADSKETASRAAWDAFHAGQPANSIRTVATDEGVVAFIKNKDGLVTRMKVHEALDLRTKK